jgi:hypothetical protein
MEELNEDPGKVVPRKTDKQFDMQSNSVINLVKSLIKFQSEITDIKKDKVNPFFNSQYVDINTVIGHIRPTLSKNGLGISQGNRYCTDSNGFYVSTTLFHMSGEWIKSEVRMPIGGKKDAQAVGASITYGRRYGLLGLLGISVEGDDDDGNSTQRK